ncbi:MAG TPA: NBR1-Ig-like domain-containing protein, partial [Pyrinomonadaceae bacterium]
LAANPYFTFHATVKASTPTSTLSYDASYGIVEPEVKIMQAVNSSGACVNGEAANLWRVESPTWMTLFGDAGYACGVTASTGGTGIPRAASVVSQSVPTFMEAGASYLVSVTLQNNGDNTWTDADLYRLGAQNPQDNWTWGINRAALPRSVAPGEQVTIEFYVTAPSYPGYYNFQWRMVQDGVEWFGDHTPNVVVEVYSLNTCDPWQEQDCWNRGGSWDSSSCYCYGGWYYY